MREVLIRVRALLGHRKLFALWAVIAGGSCGLVALPLLNQPGYELAAALSLVHGLVGGIFAVGVGRVEREATDRNFPLAAITATLVLWLGLVPPLVVATLAAALSTRCDPFATAAFVPLLTLPSSLVAAAAGVFVGSVTRRWWSSALGWLAVIAVSAAHTTCPILFGPQIFAYAHLAGYLPGPLYDEALRVPNALLWFRLGSVALAVAAIAARARRRRARTVTLAVSVLVFVALEVNGTSLGFRMSDAALREALGGTAETAQLIVHYPRELEPADVTRLVDDVRFRYAQIATFLGQTPPGRVTVWWYRSSAEKQRLVGAADTQFSKPWRREVHVDSVEFPHRVLKHELVHAMAAVWGAPPFGVTAQGLWPAVGIVEGLAVAADNPVDDLRLHEWAAAMKRKGLLPDVRVLLDATGFYSVPPSRAYTTAGSFLRYLGDQYGGERLRVLYRAGDFSQAYGKSLATLADDYERFLDGVPLDEAAVNAAFGRFKGGSIFERPCAREVANLLAGVGSEPLERALATYQRCQAIQPAEPRHRLNQARVLHRLHRDAEATALEDRLLTELEQEIALWAEVAMERAALALELRDEALARALLTRIIERQVSPTMERTARVRLAGLDQPQPAREAIARYFDGPNDRTKLYFLARASTQRPAWPLAYLLGRRLAQDHEPAEALQVLSAVLDDPSTPASVARETVRLAIEAAFAVGDCARLRLLAARPADPAFEARAADWVERCAFVSGDKALGAK